MDRPTCGTCPHRMQDTEDCVYRCFANGPRSIMVMSDDPGCRHHPAMGKWLASLEETAAQPVVESKPQRDDKQRYGYRQPGKTLSDELAELSVVREWLLNLPYPPPGETLAERLAGVSAGWLARGNALAELEQWRGALVWRGPFAGMMFSLRMPSTEWELADVRGSTAGHWTVGGGGQRYATCHEAMRAAEAALGLPPCRVKGEP